MGKSIRTIVYVALGAGILAFFGSFLIPAIIKAAPSSGKDAIRDMILDDREIVAAFLGFLGAIIGLLKSFDTQGPADDDEEEDSSESASAIRKDDPRNRAITILKQRLSTAKEAASHRALLARKIGKSAVKFYSYHTVLWVALIFSICTFASGALQGALQDAFPTKPEAGWPHYALAFFQTEALLLCACSVPLWYYSRFLRRTSRVPPWAAITQRALADCRYFSPALSHSPI